MNNISEKIKKSSRIGETVSKILLILFSVVLSLGIMAVTTVLIAYHVNPDFAAQVDTVMDATKKPDTIMNLPGIEDSDKEEISAGFKVFNQYMSLSGISFSVLMGLVLAIVVFEAVFMLALISLVYVIFRKINQSGTPFIPEVSKYLKIIAWIIIAKAFVSFSGNGFIFNFGLTSILIGLICLFVATVFEYGCHLQAEADTTL